MNAAGQCTPKCIPSHSHHNRITGVVWMDAVKQIVAYWSFAHGHVKVCQLTPLRPTVLPQPVIKPLAQLYAKVR
jgi:hypothetical protein